VTITLAGAFLGGVLTLLSPCSVMLLPAFFAYAFEDVDRVLARTGVFSLGLLTTLVPLGVLASTLGALVSEHRTAVATAVALLVVGLGLLQLAGVALPRLGAAAASGTTSASVYLLGTVYGLSGVCAGPLLGAVLVVAGFSGEPFRGGAVMIAFASGMAVPLVVLSLAWLRLGPAAARLVRPRGLSIGRWRSSWASLASGLLTIAIGVLLVVTDGTAGLAGVLGASSQAALEGKVASVSSRVPDWGVIVTAVSLAVLALTVPAALRRRRHQDQAQDQDQVQDRA
jgi:cytochrome c-type biogenesis protein